MVLLEKTLRHIQIQSALTPYVFPDPQALCEHLPVIWQLATGGQLLLIVPNIVVDILHILRREDKQASADITFLEGELKRGNKYLLCQSFVSVMLVKPRMTRQVSDAWDLCNILDLCRGLLHSSWPGTPDHNSMITILMGICLDNPRNFSYHLPLALGTAKTIALTKWTFIGKVMSLLFNMLSKLVIAFLPRSKNLNFMALVIICSDFGALQK